LIDGLVFFPAGNINYKNFSTISSDEIIKEIKVQVTSLFNIIKFLDSQLELGSSIVVLGSDVTFGKPPTKMLTYNVVKNAQFGLVKSLAVELGKRKIRVNMISPGIVNLTNNVNTSSFSVEKYRVDSSLNKLCTPKDVTNLIEFLLSNKSSHMTGLNIRLNGGNSFD